jgi:hypothetical protein
MLYLRNETRKEVDARQLKQYYGHNPVNIEAIDTLLYTAQLADVDISQVKRSAVDEFLCNRQIRFDDNKAENVTEKGLLDLFELCKDITTMSDSHISMNERVAADKKVAKGLQNSGIEYSSHLKPQPNEELVSKQKSMREALATARLARKPKGDEPAPSSTNSFPK